MATSYSIEPITDDGISFGRGDEFWKQLVTALWTKRGEVWSYPQDAYGVGMIKVAQGDRDVLDKINLPEAKFVIGILDRISGDVYVTRHP